MPERVDAAEVDDSFVFVAEAGPLFLPINDPATAGTMRSAGLAAGGTETRPPRIALIVR